MGNDHTQLIVTLLTLGLQLLFCGAIPWVIKISERLKGLETTIQNGLRSDVREIKDKCPGCLAALDELGRRVERLENNKCR